MPLMKVYNIDSDLYGLKGHSIFKSVCNTRSFVKRNLRPSYTNSFSRKSLLPRRPSATKHRPNTVEAEYIAASHCCEQLLWMRQTLRDYGYKLSKVPLLCDNESAIRMADNPVEHSRTKHIDIRYHFLRDHQQRGISR
jgi:hypothetical protein